MTNMRPDNTSEKKLIQAVQGAIGAEQDGVLGPASAVDIAAKIGANCWPLTIQLYGNPVIVTKDVVVSNPTAGCRSFSNSLSGSFSYNKRPCSILVNDGKVISTAACHGWLGNPESVLYRLKDGTFGIKRCLSAGVLPDGVKWAVGGMGLLDMYDPEAEGFTGKYSDVLRRTNHTVLGVKNGMVYLVYVKSKTGAQVNEFCRNSLHLTYAVMLDGGHVAAINGAEKFAQINTAQVQYYLIQGVGG